MERIQLEVQPRSELGKGHAGRLRRHGLIPAIIYGRETPAESVSLEEKVLRAALRKGLRLGRMVELSVGTGSASRMALLREMQQDPVSGRPIHLDFQVVLDTQALVVEVPLELQGTPVGVREESGRLEQHVWRVKIRSLPNQIPDRMILDVSTLRAGSSVHVSDISWTDGTLLSDPALAVASVLRPRVEAAAGAAEEGEPTAAEGIEPAQGS